MSAERAHAARAALDGEYEIVRELGVGGTAIVYLARERATGEEVAVKLIRATFLEDEEALARFAREARYASRLWRGVVLTAIMCLVAGLSLVTFGRAQSAEPATACRA